MVLQSTSRTNSEMQMSELDQAFMIGVLRLMGNDNEDTDDSDDSDVSQDSYVSGVSWARRAPAAHGRFGSAPCAWCDRVTVPAMDWRRIGSENMPPCGLCEKDEFQHVFEKSIALSTLKRFLRVMLSEELGDAVTIAVLTSLCGSFSITMVPLARMHHVYCTLLQKSSPCLALRLGSYDDAEDDDAVQLGFRIHPSVVFDLIFDFLYFVPVIDIQ